MTEIRKNFPLELNAFLGDFQGLLHQIGSSSDVELPQKLFSDFPVTDLTSLLQFLRSYAAESLFPLELPMICKAYYHAARYECRELIALDQQLQSDPRQRFKSCSSTVGRTHLLNLRPLRENRIVQRYLAALDSGTVQAWHTLVYGLSLSIYSVPLRQGLLAYAALVLNAFAQAAASRLSLPSAQLIDMVREVLSQVPKQIDILLTPQESIFRAA